MWMGVEHHRGRHTAAPPGGALCGSIRESAQPTATPGASQFNGCEAAQERQGLQPVGRPARRLPVSTSKVTEMLPSPQNAASPHNISTIHQRALAYGVPIVTHFRVTIQPSSLNRITGFAMPGRRERASPRAVGQRGMRVTREHRQAFDPAGYS